MADRWEELERLHKESAKASPMPWSAHRVGDQWTVRDAPVPDGGFPDGCLLAEIPRSRPGYSCPEDRADATLIAALRNAAPALLAAAREGADAVAEAAYVRAALSRLLSYIHCTPTMSGVLVDIRIRPNVASNALRAALIASMEPTERPEIPGVPRAALAGKGEDRG